MDPFAAVQLVCSTSRHRPKSTKGMRFQLLGPPCSVAKEVYGWHCASPVGQLQVDDTVVRLAIVRPTVSADLWTASSDAHRLPVRCHLAAAPHSAQCLLLLYAGALIGSAHHQLRCTALCRWVMETMACTLSLTRSIGFLPISIWTILKLISARYGHWSLCFVRSIARF